MIRLAINGYGRIGRCVLRALYESAHCDNLRVVAINEPADLATVVHLTKYDSTHGRFPGTVEAVAGGMVVNGDRIAISHHESLDALDWGAHPIDVVLECSGQYDRAAQLQRHLDRGAARVLLSQPGEADIPAVVYGINHGVLDNTVQLASAASCTTNCVVPVIEILHRRFGVESGCITTIHSAMNDQPVLDAYHHTDLRKTRAAGLSVIPIDTALAVGIGRVLPHLDGRFAARALRIPTHNVSAMELTVQVSEAVSAAVVNHALEQAATRELQRVLGYTVEPLASCDFNHDPHSGIVDAGQTRVAGNLVNVLTWFDNEWGYANRMLDVVAAWVAS